MSLMEASKQAQHKRDFLSFGFGWARKQRSRDRPSFENAGCSYETFHARILTSQAASRNDVRTQFLESYGETLDKLKVPNLMRSVILTSIDEWNKDQNYTCPITQDIRRDRALHEAVRAQNEIEWDQFLRGYIAKSFQYCYNCIE
mgnify:CR=1 FL=1